MTNVNSTLNSQNFSIENVVKKGGPGNFRTSQPFPFSPKPKPTEPLENPIPSDNNRQSVYTRVTNKIISDVEKGNLTWIKPWKNNSLTGCISRPLRFDGTPYQGINVIALWGMAAEKGYACPVWMTFKKAKELGGCVKKGEKGAFVVYANTFSKSEVDDKGEETVSNVPFLKGYAVFNVEQISGLPEKFYTPLSYAEDTKTRLESVEKFIANTKAIIKHGGAMAFYSPGRDFIQMPPFQSFHNTESYYATLIHESIHWTGHPSRLDRKFGIKRFGDSAYAMEELVAEIGAAFLCADLGITPETREDHAAYIQSWLAVLKKDSRAIFTAASYAQRAVDYLYGLSIPTEL